VSSQIVSNPVKSYRSLRSKSLGRSIALKLKPKMSAIHGLMPY